MHFSKFPVSKSFLMWVTWEILWILPCSVSLTFTTLLKDQVECMFVALMSFQHLYSSYWFSRDILSLTKSLPKNFKIESSWDLMPIFLHLCMADCFCLCHWNFIITMSDLFILWHSGWNLPLFRGEGGGMGEG